MVFGGGQAEPNAVHRSTHHSATVCLLLIPLLLVGAGQLLDRFPHASVNVRRESSHFCYLISLELAVVGESGMPLLAPQTRLWQ